MSKRSGEGLAGGASEARGGDILVLENIISDRGSRYAVSGGPCETPDAAAAFLKDLKRRKKFAKATHNTWACLTADGPLKNDDGESGAGMVILRMSIGTQS
ncbi:Uncharacterized protein family UPF0029 [Antarctobacter heliothermus]|uniref:Uncharacterized protein family UPF0029 n=1 Tax=Antarctobacter heliothermus TaxID=74033 RepID=A0A239G4Q3_9RHOB|nr:Uncharacterized protein family UPF0029 [Antarctobacter heliothermus]